MHSIVLRANPPSGIAWRGWERAAFDEARRSRKLVLLHIAASWSHSGRQMDAEAWTDSVVVRLVRNHFIPIRVDADRRPDIADRYLAGGWPTTAVLNADGQELLAQPVVETRGLIQFLEHVRDLDRKEHPQLEVRSLDSARRVAATWKSEPAPPPETPLGEWVDRNLAAVREAEDHDHGGLLGSPKNPPFEAARFLFAVTATHADEALRSLGLRLLDASFHLEDAVWGGFYRMASETDWKNPRTEKLLDVNARAIDALVAATEQGGGAAYREAARRTEAWAANRLWTTRGGWYGSESADAIASDGSERLIGGDVYYGLPDHFRRLQGAPAVDSSLYAEQNARMAAAVLRGAAAGLWKGAPVARAVKALDRLWSSQRAPDGSLYHEWRNGRKALPGRLMDQAEAGVAYLEAYAVTGEARHLARAESLAVWMRAHLEDRVAGGFRYAPRDPAAIGRLAAGEKPEQGNLDAGWLYWRLWQLKHRPEDRRSAERALESLRSGETMVLDPAEAELGLAMRAAQAASP